MAEIHDRMPLSTGRFPPPWIVEQHNNACFIIRDAAKRALGYFLFSRRSPVGARRPSCSPGTRRGGWRSTSPSCRSCCDGAVKSARYLYLTYPQNEQFYTDLEKCPRERHKGRFVGPLPPSIFPCVSCCVADPGCLGYGRIFFHVYWNKAECSKLLRPPFPTDLVSTGGFLMNGTQHGHGSVHPASKR